MRNWQWVFEVPVLEKKSTEEKPIVSLGYSDPKEKIDGAKGTKGKAWTFQPRWRNQLELSAWARNMR